MRVLVFSDSHGRVSPMADAVELYRPDVAFHLGDVTRDADNLRLACPHLRLYQVPGNCDWGSAGPNEGVVELAGKTIFYLHGHTRGVKSGIGQAVSAAQALGAHLLLFGHTHRPLQSEYDGLLAVNPGAVKDGRCALLTWEPAGPIQVIPLGPQ